MPIYAERSEATLFQDAACVPACQRVCVTPRLHCAAHNAHRHIYDARTLLGTAAGRTHTTHSNASIARRVAVRTLSKMTQFCRVCVCFFAYSMPHRHACCAAVYSFMCVCGGGSNGQFMAVAVGAGLAAGRACARSCFEYIWNLHLFEYINKERRCVCSEPGLTRTRVSMCVGVAKGMTDRHNQLSCMACVCVCLCLRCYNFSHRKCCALSESRSRLRSPVSIGTNAVFFITPVRAWLWIRGMCVSNFV